MTRDLEEIGEVAHHGPEDAFIALMKFVGAFAPMFWINPQLTFIVALIVPAMLALVIVYGGRMTHTWREIYSRVGNFNVRLEEAWAESASCRPSATKALRPPAASRASWCWSASSTARWKRSPP